MENSSVRSSSLSFLSSRGTGRLKIKPSTVGVIYKNWKNVGPTQSNSRNIIYSKSPTVSSHSGIQSSSTQNASWPSITASNKIVFAIWTTAVFAGGKNCFVLFKLKIWRWSFHLHTNCTNNSFCGDLLRSVEELNWSRCCRLRWREYNTKQTQKRNAGLSWNNLFSGKLEPGTGWNCWARAQTFKLVIFKTLFINIHHKAQIME